jgi:hypothetical protein
MVISITYRRSKPPSDTTAVQSYKPSKADARRGQREKKRAREIDQLKVDLSIPSQQLINDRKDRKVQKNNTKGFHYAMKLKTRKEVSYDCVVLTKISNV